MLKNMKAILATFSVSLAFCAALVPQVALAEESVDDQISTEKQVQLTADEDATTSNDQATTEQYAEENVSSESEAGTSNLQSAQAGDDEPDLQSEVAEGETASNASENAPTANGESSGNSNEAVQQTPLPEEEEVTQTEAAESPTAESQSDTTAETTASSTDAEAPLTTQSDPAPNASISYRTHVQKEGWQSYVKDGAMSGTSGKSYRLEGINIYVTSDVSGGVQYQVHVQNIGWQDVKSNNAMAGTSGKSYRLEAIRIMLTGELSKWYDVVYRTHVQKEGWQGWVKNGAMSGTSGKGYRLEGIEIKLVEKNAKQTNATEGIVNVRYRGHVQNKGWQAWCMNGTTAGTSGESLRVEALNINLDKGVNSGGIEYSAHVQNIGWQDWKANGAMAGTSGKSLRVEAFKIRLTGEMADKYDVVYRTHVQSVGWQNWALNGTVAGTSGKSLRVEALQIKLVKKGTSQTISEGTYFFSPASGITVSAEDPNASTKSGTQARVYTTNYTTAQRYYVRNEGDGTYSIQSVASGLFLADQGGKVVQLADSTAKTHRWKASWNGGYSLVNASTGKAFGIADNSAKSGKLLVTQTPSNAKTQHWTLTQTSLIPNGTYVLSNALTGTVLDVDGASWNNGANVSVHSSNGGGNQSFTLQNKGNDTYTIICALNGKAVEVNHGYTTNGANVRQYKANGSNAQLWAASIDRNGKLLFTNKASGKAMTAASSSSSANVVSKTNTDAKSQQWTLKTSSYKPDTVLQRAMSKINNSSSNTKYYIAVDLTNHRTIVFSGSKGNWTPIKNWTVSTGAPSSPTVRGDYTVGIKGYSFGSGYTCYYYTQFYGDYLFHSVLYYQGTRNIMDGRLGYSISHGCVRMNIDHAKWIYDHIPGGTHVKTYY